MRIHPVDAARWGVKRITPRRPAHSGAPLRYAAAAVIVPSFIYGPIEIIHLEPDRRIVFPASGPVLVV